jgi:hypothetical protein
LDFGRAGHVYFANEVFVHGDRRSGGRLLVHDRRQENREGGVALMVVALGSLHHHHNGLPRFEPDDGRPSTAPRGQVFGLAEVPRAT